MLRVLIEVELLIGSKGAASFEMGDLPGTIRTGRRVGLVVKAALLAVPADAVVAQANKQSQRGKDMLLCQR